MLTAPLTLMVQITSSTHEGMYHESRGGVELLLKFEICEWFQDVSKGQRCQHISRLSHVLCGMRHNPQS